jgi:DNA-binding transcriptional ArsR family regulator
VRCEVSGRRDGAAPRWTFLTNHAHVLLCIHRRGDVLVREIAEDVGITERTVHLILNDLEEAGFVTRHRVGRRTYYEVDAGLPLRHPIDDGFDVGTLLEALSSAGRPAADGGDDQVAADPRKTDRSRSSRPQSSAAGPSKRT